MTTGHEPESVRASHLVECVDDLRDQRTVPLSAGTPLCPHGIAYRVAHGLFTSGAFKKSQCSPMCEVGDDESVIQSTKHHARGQDLRVEVRVCVAVQGFLAHNKPPPSETKVQHMPRVIWWSLGVGRFLMSEVPLYLHTHLSGGTSARAKMRHLDACKDLYLKANARIWP